MTKERLGLYENLPEDDYHSDSALGSSDLKVLSRSLEEFVFFKNCPEELGSSKSLDLGSALHYLILEGFDKFFDEFKIRIKPRGKTFYGRGDKIISRDDFNKLAIWCRKLKVYAQNHDLLNKLLQFNDIQTEVSYFWEQDDLRYKCRFDCLIDKRIIIDIKTVANTYREPFNSFCDKQMVKYKYYLQAQHYLNGLNHFNNNKKTAFIFILIEKNAPYRIALKWLQPDILEHAQSELDFSINKYKDAKRLDCWLDTIDEKPTMDSKPFCFL